RTEEDERSMDATIPNVVIYLTATFAAALVTGMAGFAFGLVAAGVWLHILTVWFFGIGLPALLAGTWLGLKLYGHLDEAGFRKLVLVLLLVSGMALVAPCPPVGMANKCTGSSIVI